MTKQSKNPRVTLKLTLLNNQTSICQCHFLYINLIIIRIPFLYIHACMLLLVYKKSIYLLIIKCILYFWFCKKHAVEHMDRRFLELLDCWNHMIISTDAYINYIFHYDLVFFLTYELTI